MNRISKFTRRKFLRDATMAGLTTLGLPALSAIGKTHASHAPGTGLDLAVAKNGTPGENTVAAIKALGGIERFVKSGDTVVLKPNCISPQAPEYAVNTHPDVVKAVTRLCMEAGAKEVIAVTHDPARNFAPSGIEAALVSEGGSWEVVNNIQDFREVLLPRGILLRRTDIANRVLDADVFINIPIAKDFGGTSLTLGMKNFMGINYDRQIMHALGIQQCIADLATAIKPHLIIIDANYMLLTNGTGGPGSTRNQKTVIAGTDQVMADAFAATLFKFEPQDIDYIRFAAQMGLGSMDLNNARIQEFNLQ